MMAGLIHNAGANGGTSYLYNSYTINTTTLVYTGTTTNHSNNYTTDANTKLTELNAGIDEVGATTSTESPWVADDTTNPINGGYPVLSWQLD